MRVRGVFFGLILFLGVLYAEGALRVTFSITMDSETERDGIVEKESHSGEQVVVLGSHFIDISGDEGRRIYDFSKMKILDGVSGELARPRSIYTDVGFRSIEFYNRMKLSEMLEAAGILDNPMDRVLVEHLMSIRSGEAAGLTRTENDTEIVYSHGDKKLLSWRGTGRQLNEEECARFVLFLRYQYGIHPDILEELAEKSVIPKKMNLIRFNTAQRSDYSIEFVLAEETNDSYEVDVCLPWNSDNTEPLMSACAKAADINAEKFDRKNRELIEEAVQLAEAEDYLNSALVFIEYTLSSGSQMPPEFFPFKDEISANADTKLLFSSMSPQSEEAAQQALLDFAALSPKIDAGRHAFWIFQANLFSGFGRVEEAKELFLKTLNENPGIVGAWKDLGDIYHRQFDCVSAWQCWDIGRAIFPTHGLFEPVVEMEEELRSDYPEFFLRVKSN